MEKLKNEIIVPSITKTGDFLNLVALLRGSAKEIYKGAEIFNIISHPSLFKRAGTDQPIFKKPGQFQHVYEKVDISERERIIDKNYIHKWLQDVTLPDNILRMESIGEGIDLGLVGDLTKCRIVAREAIEYTFNIKTKKVFSNKINGVKLSVLKAIMDDLLGYI